MLHFEMRYFVGCFLHIDPSKNCDYQGDGYCDDSNNNADCDFDDGDCCLNPVNTQFCNECWCYADNTSYVSGKITGQNFFLE